MDQAQIRCLVNSLGEENPKENYKFGRWDIHNEEIFFYSPLCIGFVNTKPVVDGHVLIATKRVVASLGDLTEDEVKDMFYSSQLISEVMKRKHSAQAATVTVQDGPDAGQTVPHVHVHIMPRKKGDFEKNDEIYEAIDKAGVHRTDDEERKARTLPQMAEEAQAIQKVMREMAEGK